MVGGAGNSGSNLFCVVAEDHKQRADLAAQDFDETFQKRFLAERQEGFVAPHAARFTGGQNDACDH